MKPKPSLASLTPIAATLSLLVPAHADTETWSGATNGTWDITTANWLTDGTNNLFESGDSALFAGTPTNNVTAATGLTIGAITLDSTFTGSVTMSGANTVSGATTISGGTLNLTNASGLGASAITVNSGGILSLSAGNATYTNTVSGAGVANVTTNPSGDANLNGNWSGFTGTLNLNGSGNFKTRFNTNQANLISSSATINVNAGTTLYLNQALNYGASVHLFGAGNSENLGALRIESNGNQTGSVTLHGNSFIGANFAATISGSIGETGGSFGFTKQGSNTLTLTGNNTYTGATILSSGTLSVSSDSAGAYHLGGAGTNGITFDGGTLQITGTTMTSFGSHTPNFNAGKTVTLDIAHAANNFTISQALNQTTGGLTKLGAGTLTLSGANTYSGGTRANAGTLVLSGTRPDQAGGGDWLSVNNIGAQNATLKIISGANWGIQDFNIGEATNSRAAVHQTGGALTAANGVWIGDGGSTYGYCNLTSGTLTNTGGDFAVARGSGSTGVMDVSGGSLTTSSWIVLGRNGGTASGLLNVTGGSVTSNSNNIGLSWSNGAGAISILNVGGGAGSASVTGASNAGNYLDVAQVNSSNATGVVNALTNGTLTVAQVRANGASATALFNFNGGTLKATAANAGANFMNSGSIDAVTVYGGGGTIDNNGTDITIGNALAAATGNGVSSIAVTDGGSGYIGAPMVKITGGTGNTATGYAVMADDGTGNGTYRVSSIVITSGGTYSVDPTTVTLTGGGASTAATIGAITTTANTSGGMTFTGSGTTTLSNSNTYTGKTTISGGSVALGATGSIANSSEIELNGGNFNVSAVTGFTVGASQALTGSGSITGDITVTGTLAIGNSPGTMTFNDDLTIGAAAVSNFEFTNTAFGLGTYDLAQGGVGTQTVTFGGTLNLFFSGGTYSSSSSVQIFDFENYSGDFTAVTFSGLGLGQSASFDSSTGFVTVIPEPEAALLGGVGLLVLLRRRRD